MHPMGTNADTCTSGGNLLDVGVLCCDYKTLAVVLDNSVEGTSKRCLELIISRTSLLYSVGTMLLKATTVLVLLLSCNNLATKYAIT